MIWDGLNQRKFPRLKVPCDIAIKEEGTSSYDIAVLTDNIGAGGISVVLKKPLARFSVVSMSLNLDDGMDPVESRGKIVWVVKSKTFNVENTTYDTGIEFLDINHFDRERIKKIITEKRSTAEAA